MIDNAKIVLGNGDKTKIPFNGNLHGRVGVIMNESL